MKLQIHKPDNLGAFASTLCMIHCALTPFIFITKTCSITCCQSAPSWWKWIDYLFLAISLLAVYHSTEKQSKKWIKLSLWTSWIILFITILNETLGLIELPKYSTYIAASALVIIHLYNRKNCNCNETECQS